MRRQGQLGASGGPINRTVDRTIRRLAVLAVAGLVLTVAILSFPARKEDASTAIDFSIYYSAAQMMRQGLGPQLYDLNLQAAFQSRVAAVHVFYNHPPYEALFFLPFTYLGYRSAYIAWTIINVGLLSYSTYVLARTTALREALSQYTRLNADWGLLFAVFLTFAPVTTCILLGQDSLLLLTINTAALALLGARRDFRAGFVLAMAMFKFHLVLPLVLLCAVRRMWSFLAGAGLSALFWTAVSIGVCGPKVVFQYPRFLLFETRHPDLAGFQPIDMPNLRGLVTWLAAGKISSRGTAIVTALLSIAVLWWAAKVWNRNQPVLSFSISIFAALLVSFHLYNYDLSLLLLPIGALCGALVLRGQLLSAVAVNVSLALLFIHPLHLFLILHGLYALMSVPILVLFFGAAGLARKLSSSDAGAQVLSPDVLRSGPV